MKPPFRHYKNLVKHSQSETPREPWFVKYWRPAAAWIYLAICIFDFVIMPLYMSKFNLSVHTAIVESAQIRPEDRITALGLILKKNTWEPLTLAESGMFHLAFGAILGVAAWTRGQLQQTQVQNGIFPAIEEPSASRQPSLASLDSGPTFVPMPVSAPYNTSTPGSDQSFNSPPLEDSTPTSTTQSQDTKYNKFDSPD